MDALTELIRIYLTYIDSTRVHKEFAMYLYIHIYAYVYIYILSLSIYVSLDIYIYIMHTPCTDNVRRATVNQPRSHT